MSRSFRRVGLRGRLVAFFIAITVLPLIAAVAVLHYQIDAQLQSRAEQELDIVGSGVVALVQAERTRAADLADELVAVVRDALADGDLPVALDDPATLQPWLDDAVRDVPGRADAVALVDAQGVPVAVRLREPQMPLAADPAAQLADAASAGTPPEAAILEIRELRAMVDGADELVGWVVTGLWADEVLLERLGVVGGVALERDGQVLASRGADDPPVPVPALDPGETFATVEAGETPVVATRATLTDENATQSAIDLVLWTPRATRWGPTAVGWLVVLPSVALAGLLGWLLATAVVAPVRRAAQTARAVAAGDLSRTLPPTGGPELADLANALNRMSSELARRMEELARSRDQLRGSLDRLGETLSSSLDLNRMLAVVVETARDTLVADRALLMLYTPERDALYCKVARGVEDVPGPLPLGQGVLGHVATAAAPVLLPDDEDLAVSPADSEPTGASQLAVPLLGRGRVLGVLTLLRDDPEQPFGRADLDTVRTFAAQASVAIENVLLHQEARRLSVTDPLTGLWNFRYFQLQAERELEGAERFDRPLSLIIVDLDHFKAVNDEHGHQVGDVVLAEVAHRLREATRTPDVVARYGGEEFVVLLPGTDADGALVGGERIREAVAERPIDVRGVPVPVSHAGAGNGPAELTVTCSVGIASFPDHGRSVASLLRAADAAMYRAKRIGRNRVVEARPDEVAQPTGDRASEHRRDAGRV